MFRAYLKVQIKRLLRVLPMAVLFNFIMILGICAIFVFTIAIQSRGEKRIGVGVVGNIENKYMKLGVEMLNNMDASRFSVKFESLDEENAKKALREGRIAGYFKIDKDFIEGLENGENRPVIYVSSSGGLMNELSKEVASVFSVLIVNSERVIYAVDEYLSEHKNVYDRETANTELNMSLLKNVFTRGKIYNIETKALTGEVSVKDNYICAMIIILTALSGVGLGSLLSGKKDTLQEVLKSRGLSYISSIICELITVTLYILILIIFGFGIFLLAINFLQDESFISPDYFEFFCNIFAVSIMFASMHLFIYELIYQRVTAVLTEIILGISLCYIGGCIYPLSFFPDIIQKISVFLPSTAGKNILISGLGYRLDLFSLAVVFLYTVLFMGGVYVLRCKK
ncbi:ABC transporter permease [Lachnoanaerobaculum sp. Marseille-Q4761]|uniref:ABC transporter permease n=1 Tax=Lachnoanaerobaculum sp. Marseille-Q4761 TaxID=2819511 RepID=UPI001FB80F90|nr:ABC transporter permease [Lachnoanaerobaculum sp. Marseille-Q4761]